MEKSSYQRTLEYTKHIGVGAVTKYWLQGTMWYSVVQCGIMWYNVVQWIHIRCAGVEKVTTKFFRNLVCRKCWGNFGIAGCSRKKGHVMV